MRKFWIDCLLATLFVFGVLLGLREVADLTIFNAFDPIGQSLGDMEFTDITFSRLRQDPPIDTNIVIVNISELSRAEIGQQINVISKYKPKVIGIDSFFDCPGGITDSVNCPQAYDTLSNLIFAGAIANAGNVVMVTKLLQSDSLLQRYGDIDIYDSLEHTDENLRLDTQEGYASLETDASNQEDLKSCRRFNPRMQVGNKEEVAFSVRMAMIYDSAKTKRFLARNNHSEVINYRGNIYDPFEASEYPGRYYTLDWYQALDSNSFTPGMFKDKIVIMGYLGKDLGDTSWDDKFFTPLNKKFAGKSRPDMYGVVVHANIVSMIISEDYVNELDEWQQTVIAFIICLLNTALFTLIQRYLPIWFDGLTLLCQLLEIVLLIGLMVYIFYVSNFKLNLTATLAALALVGTCFELYMGVLKEGFELARNKWFTKKDNNVLTSETP